MFRHIPIFSKESPLFIKCAEIVVCAVIATVVFCFFRELNYFHRF